MKKEETFYSYLFKKTNGIYAVKYKIHKQADFKYTSLRTRNEREAKRKKRVFDLSLMEVTGGSHFENINDELQALAKELLKKMTSGGLTANWLIMLARKAHHIESGSFDAIKEYTLAEYIDCYLESLRRDLKPQSYKVYLTYSLSIKGLRTKPKGGFSVVDKQIYEITQKPLHLLETRDIRKISENLRKKNIRAKTINQSLALLRRTLKQADKDELTHRDLSKNVDYLRNTDSLKRGTYTDNEVEALLKTAEGDWKGVILTAVYTGLRATNCHLLSWEDVDLENKLIKVIPVKRRKGFNKGFLPLPLEGRLLSHLKSLALTAGDERSGFIFKTSGLKDDIRSKRFKSIREKAGVPYEVYVDGLKQKRDFHSLRHYHNTKLKAGGATPEERMAQLGHSSFETNQVYTHHELDHRRKVLKQAFSS